jgi:TonB family protein
LRASFFFDLQFLSFRIRYTMAIVNRGLVLCAVFVGALMLMGALAQTRQARFFGRLTNGDGNPIPNAVIVLCNSSANLWFITSTDATGSFELVELPANQFSIEVLSPQWRRPTRNPGRDQIWGYSPWTDSFTLQAGQSMQRNIQLGGLTQQPRTSQTSPPCIPQRRFSVLGEEGLARLLVQQTTPVYPQNARDANIEGPLTFEAFMNKDGNVISLRLLTPSWPPAINPVLTRAAVEAIRDWRYHPPQLLGSRDEVTEFGGPITVKFHRDR